MLSRVSRNQWVTFGYADGKPVCWNTMAVAEHPMGDWKPGLLDLIQHLSIAGSVYSLTCAFLANARFADALQPRSLSLRLAWYRGFDTVTATSPVLLAHARIMRNCFCARALSAIIRGCSFNTIVVYDGEEGNADWEEEDTDEGANDTCEESDKDDASS